MIAADFKLDESDFSSVLQILDHLLLKLIVLSQSISQQFRVSSHLRVNLKLKVFFQVFVAVWTLLDSKVRVLVTRVSFVVSNPGSLLGSCVVLSQTVRIEKVATWQLTRPR